VSEESRTGMSTRKAQAEETRRRILDVAVEAFSAQHYDAVAVSDIAASAGVAHGLLFHYFKNKRGLYLAAMEEAAREFEEAHRTDPNLPPGTQMRQRYYNQFAYLARRRGLAARLVLVGSGADPEAWEFFEKQRWREIEHGCEALGLDPTKPALRMMLRAAAAAADGVVAYWHANGQPFDIKALTDVLFEQTIVALQGAAQLDPTLEAAVTNAIKQLRADV